MTAGKIASRTKNETPPAIDNRRSELHLAVRAPEDVVPAPPGNLQRMGGVTAAATFVCPAELEVVWFVGALRLASSSTTNSIGSLRSVAKQIASKITLPCGRVADRRNHQIAFAIQFDSPRHAAARKKLDPVGVGTLQISSLRLL